MPDLPVEILNHIFKEVTSVRDILSLQQVSKQFRDIIHDPSFSKGIYTRAPLPRPSGPFEWQSPGYLMRKLTQSDRVAHIWKESKLTQLSLIGDRPFVETFRAGYWKIIRSRWLLLHMEKQTQLLCLDLKTGSKQILRKESKPFLSSATVGVSVNGEIFYHLTVMTEDSRNLGKLDIYRVDEPSSSFSLVESFEIPDKYMPTEMPEIFVEGHLVSLSTMTEILVFDSRNRIFYTYRGEFPETEDGYTDNSHEKLRHPTISVILAKTHILVYRHWIWGVWRYEEASVIHAFATAEATMLDDDGPFYELQVTHVQTVKGFPGPLCLLFEPFVHPTEGYTRVGFLNCRYDLRKNCEHPTQFTYIDLKLDSGNPWDDGEGEYAKIHVAQKQLFDLETWVHSVYVQSSNDGHVRGICLAGDDTTEMYRFSIDLEGGFDDFPREAVVDVGDRWSDARFSFWVEVFDGVKGQALVTRCEKDQQPLGELWLADIL